ncbi:MAG: HDOD domain-containing protein [candidate division Zixibacteria bacterium]|nr:HDOD domain-containing protein [candidate division Zixibacteria bacterium]
MDKTRIIEQIRENNRILSLPQTLSEILAEVGKDDFSPDSLAKIILKDPSLTGKILQLANSSFYHQLSEIKTVQQAVSILGMTTVKCMALSTSVFHPDKVASETGVDPKSFFTYVLSIAAASEQLAKCLGHQASEEAFVAGLLTDIGVLFFLHHYPREYGEIVSGRSSAPNLVEAEREIFGTDHMEVGYHLAKTWGLPDYVLKAIRGHHDISELQDSHPLTNSVSLAVLLTTDEFSGFKQPIERRLEDVARVVDELGISKEQVDEVTFSLLPKTLETAEFVGVDIGNVEEILTRANQEIWKSYLTIENLFKERSELTQKLLEQERVRGAEEAKNIAMATLSHYLNNAIMAIFGRSQIMRMHFERGQTEKIYDTLPRELDVIDNSVKRMVAVLAEMKDISPIDSKRLHSMSEALNLDDRIESRLTKMDFDSTLPEKRTAELSK